MGLQLFVCHPDQPLLFDGCSGDTLHEVQVIQGHPDVHGGAGCGHAGGQWCLGPYS